jgi:hypothetical protein
MRGLDPRIHAAPQVSMDHRVKPGGDESEGNPDMRLRASSAPTRKQDKLIAKDKPEPAHTGRSR